MRYASTAIAGGRIPAEKWQRGRMHTPAKGAGPNKGLGGSNPPFSATIPCGSRRSEQHYGFAPIFAPILSERKPRRFAPSRLFSCLQFYDKKTASRNERPSSDHRNRIINQKTARSGHHAVQIGLRGVVPIILPSLVNWSTLCTQKRH